MAEIRMLQEQQQQLQQVLGGLADTLKAMTAKNGRRGRRPSRKTAADNKLLIDNVAEGVRILREKADDTNVRLSTVSQELDAVRQAVSTDAREHRRSLTPGQDPAAAASESATAPNGTSGAPGAPAPTGQGGPLISPQKMFDNAYSDYTAGHYDIAIMGFTSFISTLPA